MAPIRQLPLASSVLLVLAVIALGIRLLIPPGYMPSFGGEKAYITLEFCSVQAEPQVVFLDPETGTIIGPDEAGDEPGRQGAQHKSHPCAFSAGTSGAALAPGAIPVLASLFWPAIYPRLPKSMVPGRSIEHLPWSTGPPQAAM